MNEQNNQETLKGSGVPSAIVFLAVVILGGVLLAPGSTFSALNESMVLARVVTLSFFIGTMVWVFVGLKRDYVNLDAPSSHLWHDLRVWTVVSMLPHVVVYFFL